MRRAGVSSGPAPPLEPLKITSNWLAPTAPDTRDLSLTAKTEGMTMTKATPRHPRSDSVKAAVAAHENAAKPPLEPPAHVRVRDRDRPFWNAIVQSRARDTWTDSDLAMAASLARAYGDIEAL